MTAQLDLPVAPAAFTSEEADHRILGGILANSLGWSTPNQLATIDSRVTGLRAHGVRQALRLILAHPESDLQDAAAALMARDDTDRLAFLGIEKWTHHSLMRTLRLIGREKRYYYNDFLQAPEVVLSEARTILAVTNLCLTGDLSNGSDNTSEVQGGWALNNRELVTLIQKHPNSEVEIPGIMKQWNTCDAALIESILETTTPLVSGVL